MKILLFILLLVTPSFAFENDLFSITYPNIQADLEEILGTTKMGPADARAPLDIHPPPGGIEGIYPIYGNIFPSPKFIRFRWSGKKVMGNKPVLILFEKEKPSLPRIFVVQKETSHLSLACKQLLLEPGKEYHWYLGKMEEQKPIAQSRVFSFRILAKQETTNLQNDLSKTGLNKSFVMAQIYYNYGMYHDMVDVLKSLERRHQRRSIKQLLFLGYVRLGRHNEAKKYEIKN